jgi:hypothetical protein
MIFSRSPSRHSRRRPGPLAGLASLWVALLCVIGCESSDAPSDTSTDRGTALVESSVNRGPIRFTVRAERGEITVGEKLKLTLDVVCPSQIDIVMPEVPDALGDFTVRERSTPPDVPEKDQRRWSHEYIIDTFASGEIEIPSLTAGFTDRRPEVLSQNEGPITGELPSDPLTITVRSVLAGDEADEDFRDIRGAVDVPVQREWGDLLIVAAIVGGGLLLVAIVVFLIVYFGMQRKPDAPEKIVPAHVWALAELDRLARDDLIGAGRYHDFYFRLSDIVRQYIERRFGIMAPERTTEEFLLEAKRSSSLGEAHKDLLAGFLRAADMVKFARHTPSAEECNAAFAAARGFVEQTVPASETSQSLISAERDRSEAAA